MAIKSAGKLLTKDIGSTNEIVCINCKKSVSLRLFENVDLSVIAAVKNKKTQTYFAVCPLCAGVFDINENYINAYKSGTVCSLTESDITFKK